MIDEAVENVNSITITKDSDIDLTMFGLEVREVLPEITKKH